MIARRTLLQSSAAAAATLLVPSGDCEAAAPATAIRKAVKYHMVKEPLSLADKFKLLKDLGFDGVEIRRRDNVDKNAALKASQSLNLPIHGVINSSDPDIITAIDLARHFGGDSVLVVAGRVNKQQRYDDVYRETQKIIRRAIPHAEKHNIKILVENVWNSFC